MLRVDHDVVDPIIVGTGRVACGGRVSDHLACSQDEMRQMLESVAEQTHVASRKRPSRRRDETGLLGPKLHHEQLAVIAPIDRLEGDFEIGRLHDCICTKMSRACSSLMRLTEVIRSANCASDDISADPTSTSTAKIEKSRSSLRWRSRADRSLEVGAAAGEVFGHLDDFVQIGLVAAFAIQVEHLEARVARGKHDGAEQAALSPRDIHQRQRYGLGPHLTVALHRGTHVDTHDLRALALLLVVAQPVLKDGAFEHAAMEIALEDGMMHREQLGGNQASELGAELDVVGFSDATLERFALESARVLLESPDHPRQLDELLDTRETPPELEARTGRDASALAEFAAEIVTVLGGLIDFARQLAGLELYALERALIRALELSLELPRLLIEPRLGDLGRAFGRIGHLRELLFNFRCPIFLFFARSGFVLALFRFLDFVDGLHRLGTRFEILFLAREIPQIEHLTAIDELLGFHHLETMFAHHNRGDSGLVFFECGARSQGLEGSRREDLLEDGAVERGRVAHVAGLAEHRVHLEQREKEILHQRAEMRDQTLARLREIGDRRRVGDDLIPRAPVVAVALEPRRIGGHNRDIPASRLDDFGFARHRDRSYVTENRLATAQIAAIASRWRLNVSLDA